MLVLCASGTSSFFDLDFDFGFLSVEGLCGDDGASLFFSSDLSLFADLCHLGLTGGIGNAVAGSICG